MTDPTTADDAGQDTPTTTLEETGQDNPTTPEPEDTRQDATGDAQDDEHPTEARKYRRRAQEAERALEETRAALDAARRALVEQHAARTLRRPDALWAAGVDPASLFHPDGTLDADAATRAVDDVAARFGITRSPRPDPSQGATSSGIVTHGIASAFTR